MTSMPLFGKITILSLSLVNFLVSHFHVPHLTPKTFKLCLKNTLNMSKTTRVYFEVLHTTSASSSSAIMASYSDSLLEELKPKRMGCSILSPVGEVNCRPIPTPECLEAPSTQRVHQPLLSRQVLGYGISAMKSAKTWPFFASLGLY